MAIPVTVGTKIVFVGDSITFQGWFSDTESLVGGSGLLVDQISTPDVRPRGGVVSGTRGTVAGGARRGTVANVEGGGQVYAINSGVSQNKVADIEAAVAARITNYAPEVVVLYVGVNDVRGLISGIPTPLATFRASYDSILDDVQLALPGVPIVCVGIPLIQEHWSSSGGAHFEGNPYDVPSGGGFQPSIAEYNTEISGSATAHSCIYVDSRSAFATAESVQNTPEPGAIDGVLTLPADGVHLSAAGQLALSTRVFTVADFQFTP